MVQPSFSNPNNAKAGPSTSPTAPLDAFLDNQSAAFYEELYRSEAACLSVLRLLPPVCRHIVLHVLWSHQPLRTSELKAFCGTETDLSLPETAKIIAPALKRKIFMDMKQQHNKMQWPLNEAFKTGLRNALTGLGRSNSFGVPFDRGSGHLVSQVEELESYAEETWESILKYMVSSGLSSDISAAKPKKQVLSLLYQSGLMTDDPTYTGARGNLDRLTITSKGFQFLLEDRQAQLWQILMYYLDVMSRHHRGPAAVLSVFFSLGCMELGQDYSASRSFPGAESVLSDLELYGFIRKRKATDGQIPDQFFPTHLATSLCAGDASLATTQNGDEKRFLILETNYKIYAYTSNELEIAILNLFVDIRMRYPNLVVGKLDRKHVKAAMDKGISAYQIIAYLSSHAHPQMYMSPPPLLHPSVVDQLHLWDKERNRLQTNKAVLLDFQSKELFEAVEGYAKTLAGLIYSVPAQKILFIDPQVQEAIRDFIKEKQNELRG